VQRTQLQSWLKANTTGNAQIRAGIPSGWIVSEKTGTGNYGTTNDIGVIWPANCPAIVMLINFTQYKKSRPNDKVIVAATRSLLQEFVHTDECLSSNLKKTCA
jgi:beta-lactamase class A